MSEWKITVQKAKSDKKGAKGKNIGAAKKDFKMKNPLLIEGMPGIGNVGKITVDLLVSELKATKIASLFSDCLPNAVFVKENHLVELPKIEIYHKQKGKRDFLFLVGDVQPMKEEDSYSLTRAVLSFAQSLGCKEVIAAGGIGLQEAPAYPRLFCTGNDKDFIAEFAKLGANSKLYGVVGPIMGISGLTLGLGKEYGIKSIALLAETSANPAHLGFRGSKEIITILEKKYKLGISIKVLEKDIEKFETEGFDENPKSPKTRGQEILEQEKIDATLRKDMNYIG